MLIFSLLVLICFSQLNGMIVPQDPYLPEVLDNHEVLLKVSDGSLFVSEKQLASLYLGDMLKEQGPECTTVKEINLTKETFYQGKKKLTVANTSQAIYFLNGKLDPLVLSQEELKDLTSSVDKLASNSSFKKVCDLVRLVYSTVSEENFDAEMRRLFSSLFNRKFSLPSDYNSIWKVVITGMPNSIIDINNKDLISSIIKNAPVLGYLKLDGAFMPVLLQGTLTNSTPPKDCIIDLSNNGIREVEPGAVKWWNNGCLILRGNPLTEKSIERLRQDTRMPLLQCFANSKASFLLKYRNSDVFKAQCALLCYGLFLHPSVSESLSELIRFVGVDVFSSLSILLGYKIGSFTRDLNYSQCRKEYFPLKLTLGNTAEYKPIFDIPLD